MNLKTHDQQMAHLILTILETATVPVKDISKVLSLINAENGWLTDILEGRSKVVPVEPETPESTEG